MHSLERKDINESSPNFSCNSDNKETEQSVISFFSDVPKPIREAMKTFLKKHPTWDQHRLMKVALAGFLVQHGKDSRSITRIYLENLFSNKSFK